MARVFFGLFPDRRQAERLAVTVKGLTAMRPVPVHQLHLTVRFVGRAPFDRLAIETTLRETLTSQPSIEMSFDRLDYFPSPQQPSVVALTGQPTDALQTLAGIVDTTLKSYGLDEPANSFRPHLTLARPLRSLVRRLPTISPVKVAFSDFRCVDSSLSPSGPTYQTLFSIRLHG